MTRHATTAPVRFDYSRLPGLIFGRASRVLALVILLIVLTALSPAFLTGSNMINVVRQASLLMLLGMGQTLVILTGGIDLSVGAVCGLGGVLAALLLQSGAPVPVAIAAGLLVGLVAGLFNGFLVALVRLPPFVASYGTMWIANGFAYVLMGGSLIFGFPNSYQWFGQGYVLGIPVPIWIALVAFVALQLLLGATIFGRQLYAVGSNRPAARFSGLPISRTLIAAYAISGMTAASTGMIITARLNAADAAMGDPWLINVIASVVIGGTSLFGGEGRLSGTIIGALIITLLTNGMNLLGLSSYLQPLIVGAVVIGAVLIDQWARKFNA